MRRITAFLTLFAAIFALAACQQAETRLLVKVADIRNNPDGYSSFTVTLRGHVENEQAMPPSEPGKGYILRDRFGDLILVRTASPVPDIGTEWYVSGVVVVRKDASLLFVGENFREPIGPPWKRYLLYGLGGLVVLLFVLVIYSFIAARGADSDVEQDAGLLPVSGPAIQPMVTPSPVQEKRTIKLSAGQEIAVSTPRAATGRLLPGRLVLLDRGRDVAEFHLVAHRGDDVEIGRESSDPIDGVRIQDSSTTLSRHQARIGYTRSADAFKLTNLVGPDRNPTKLNGRTMGENEVADLREGDLLTMGTLDFRFARS
jgi:hypothetical protein